LHPLDHGRIPRGGGADRKRHVDLRSVIRLAFDPDGAAAALDDARADRQPEAGFPDQGWVFRNLR
jgi:hypothetical protein